MNQQSIQFLLGRFNTVYILTVLDILFQSFDTSYRIKYGWNENYEWKCKHLYKSVLQQLIHVLHYEDSIIPDTHYALCVRQCKAVFLPLKVWHMQIQ